MKLYFAYGSNLHLQHMKRRCPDSEPVAPATLFGYVLTFRGNSKGYGVANIEPGKGKVFGAVYKVSEDDIESLDVYEGYPRLYIRKDVRVKLANGKTVKAFAYVMNSGYKLALPSHKYFDIIRTGYFNWELPVESLYDTVGRITQAFFKKRLTCSLK